MLRYEALCWDITGYRVYVKVYNTEKSLDCVSVH